MASPPPRWLVLGMCPMLYPGGVNSLYFCLYLLVPFRHDSVIASISGLLSHINSPMSSGYFH